MLIDPGTRDWNSSMVRHLFGHVDASATTILAIPLSSKLPRDRILCAYTPKENFTLRSIKTEYLYYIFCIFTREFTSIYCYTRKGIIGVVNYRIERF